MLINSISPRLHFPAHEPLFTVLFFVCIVILTWVKLTNPKRFRVLVTFFFKARATIESALSPDLLALFFVFLIATVTLCIQAVKLYGIKINILSEGTPLAEADDYLVMIISGVIVLWYLLKTFAILLCGAIFGVPNIAKEYVNEIYVSTNLAGIILLPVAIVSTYCENINHDLLLKCTGAGFVLLICYRTIKMLIITLKRGFRLLYLILYLCTLEICPFFLLYYFIKMNIA